MKKEINYNRIENHHITPRCLLKHKDDSFVDREDNRKKLPHHQHGKAHQWLFMLLGDACGIGILQSYYTMVKWHVYYDMTGFKQSEETKRKRSETNKGNT